MKIVIFKGKHGDAYYLYTDEEWPRICLTYFRAFDEDGGYATEREHLGTTTEPELPVDLSTYLKDSAEMPDWAHKEYEGKVKAYQRACTQKRANDRYWKYLCQAREGNLEAAQAIIENDKSNEYGGYTIEDLQEVPVDVPSYVFSPYHRTLYMTGSIQFALDGELDRAEANLTHVFEQTGPGEYPQHDEGPESDNRKSWTERAALLAHNLRRLLQNPDDERLRQRALQWLEKWG